MRAATPCPLCGASGPLKPISEDDPLVSIMHQSAGETCKGESFPVYECQSCFHMIQRCEVCRTNWVSLTRYGRTCQTCLAQGRLPNSLNW